MQIHAKIAENDRRKDMKQPKRFKISQFLDIAEVRSIRSPEIRVKK